MSVVTVTMIRISFFRVMKMSVSSIRRRGTNAGSLTARPSIHKLRVLPRLWGDGLLHDRCLICVRCFQRASLTFRFLNLYCTRRRTVIGTEPSCRGVTFQESSSPFSSYERTAVVSSRFGTEERSV